MKAVLLLISACITVFIYDPRKDLETDSLFSCNDQLYLTRPAGGGILKIKSDVNQDSTQWEVSLTGEKIFLGKISFPGLYRIQVDNEQRYVLAYSCSDVTKDRDSHLAYCYESAPLTNNSVAMLDTLNRCLNKMTLDTVNALLFKRAAALEASTPKGQAISFSLFLTLDNPVALLAYDGLNIIDARNQLQATFTEVFKLFTGAKDTLLIDYTDEMNTFNAWLSTQPNCDASNKIHTYNERPAETITAELIAHYAKIAAPSKSIIWLGYREKYYNQLIFLFRIVGKKDPA